MESVISNFEGFDELKATILEKAIVNESWAYPNPQEHTKLMLHDIEKSLEEMSGKSKRHIFNCAMDFLQMSNSLMEGNRLFNTHFAFSIIKHIPHIFMAYNRHELSVIMDWLKFVDKHNESDTQTLKGVWRDCVKKCHGKTPSISFSIIDLLRKSRNPIYYKMTPQEGENPVFELIVRVAVETEKLNPVRV